MTITGSVARNEIVMYDTAAAIGDDANTSLTVTLPEIIQLEALAEGTTVKMQQRCHSSASWLDIQSFTDSDGASMVFFAVPVNYARIIRTVGTGAVKAYAQMSKL